MNRIEDIRKQLEHILKDAFESREMRQIIRAIEEDVLRAGKMRRILHSMNRLLKRLFRLPIV